MGANISDESSFFVSVELCTVLESDDTGSGVFSFLPLSAIVWSFDESHDMMRHRLLWSWYYWCSTPGWPGLCAWFSLNLKIHSIYWGYWSVIKCVLHTDLLSLKLLVSCRLQGV
jgi:hypothetical protein